MFLKTASSPCALLADDLDLRRTSLHDDDCANYEASLQAFLPLIDSFTPVI